MKDPSAIYKRITNKEIDISELPEEEASALFSYLCEQTEQGREIDRGVFCACADRIDGASAAAAEEIISRTYQRIGEESLEKSKPRRIKQFFRSLSVAMLALIVFAVLFVGSTSVLGIDVVEKVKVIFADETSAPAVEKEKLKVVFEHVDEYGVHSEPKLYYSLEYLFSNELSQYLYPTAIPSEISEVSVVRYDRGDVLEDGGNGNNLFSILLSAKGDGEDWHIVAKPASEGYFPLGYEYKTEIEGAEISFVYTVARKNGEITRYSVYMVYGGVLYTFYMYTSDFDTVKTVVESMKLP